MMKLANFFYLFYFWHNCSHQTLPCNSENSKAFHRKRLCQRHFSYANSPSRVLRKMLCWPSPNSAHSVTLGGLRLYQAQRTTAERLLHPTQLSCNLLAGPHCRVAVHSTLLRKHLINNTIFVSNNISCFNLQSAC